MAKINSPVIRVNPELERDINKLAGELTLMDGKIYRTPEVTKRITKTASWKKALEEVKNKQMEFDLRR